MANVYDQFDAAPTTAGAAKATNPYDQFDASAKPTREPTWYDKLRQLVTSEKPDLTQKPGAGQDIIQSAPGSLARASAGFLGTAQAAIEKTPLNILQRVVSEKINQATGQPARPNVNLGATSLSGLKQLMGSTFQDPQTKPGEVADFALQTILFGAKQPKDLLNGANTLRSLVSGVAGGTAGVLVPDDYPRVKAAAQMIGGFSPSLVENALKSPDRATKNAAKMVKQAMSGKTDQEWKAADELFQKSKQVGVPLTGPEAFPGGSQVQQLASDVAASPVGGGPIRDFTSGRAGQVQATVKQHLQQIGKNVGGQEAVNQMEAAGTKVIQNAEAGRSKAVNALYRAAANDKVPEDAITGVLGKIDTAISADKTGLLAPKLQEFKNTLLEKSAPPASGAATLRDQMAGTQASSKPITDIENLDRARKYFRDKIELPAMSADAMPKEVSKAISPYLDQIRVEMENASANYQRGKALYQLISEKRVDPLMKGPVGKVAGKGADAQREASYFRVMSELSSETATPERIRTLAKEVSKVDKEAFPNVARAYLEAKLNTALKDLQGRRNPAAGANFRNAIAGTPKDRANLQAMLEETSRIQGQDPKKVSAGFDNLLEVLDATGRVPGIGSPTHGRMETEKLLSKDPVAGFLETHVFEPTKQVGKFKRQITKERGYEVLAKVFTSPESVKEMKKLADMKPNSPEARQLVSVMLSSAAQGVGDHANHQQYIER